MANLIYVVVVVLFCAAVSAHAAKLAATPPLPVAPPDGIACLATNMGKKPIDIIVEIVGADGTVVGSASPVTLWPGASTFGASASASISGAVYCRVQGFSTKQVHVTACVQTNT